MKKYLIPIFCIFLLTACTSAARAPTATSAPTSTHAPTETPQSTNTPVPEPTFVKLGSPISSSCGDGVLRILDNGSFNGPFKVDGFDQFHGHMDILVPDSCDYKNIQREFLAPASGKISKYTFPEPDFGPNETDYGYHLLIPANTYIVGIENALIFSGIQNPDLSKIHNIVLDFGHISVIEGTVQKGQSIGEIRGTPGFPPENKFAWQVGFEYDGIGYMFSPTLFEIEGPEWICAGLDVRKCEPKPNNYAP
jgi:hypothetical protein